MEVLDAEPAPRVLGVDARERMPFDHLALVADDRRELPRHPLGDVDDDRRLLGVETEGVRFETPEATRRRSPAERLRRVDDLRNQRLLRAKSCAILLF